MAFRGALMYMDDSEKWKPFLEPMWLGSLKRDGDSWTTFHCPAGEFPDVTDPDYYNVVIITGSKYCVCEPLPWISQAVEVVRTLAQSKTKIIASCFGHQLLAHALGGEVGKNPSGKFVLKVEDIVLVAPTLQACGLWPFFLEAIPGFDDRRQPAMEIMSQPFLRMLESHGDQVLRTPPGSLTLGFSETAPIEMFMLGPRILGFQFHPEMSCKQAGELILPALAESRFSKDEADASASSLGSPEFNAENDHEGFKHFLTMFMHSDLSATPYWQENEAAILAGLPGPLVLPDAETAAAEVFDLAAQVKSAAASVLGTAGGTDCAAADAQSTSDGAGSAAAGVNSAAAGSAAGERDEVLEACIAAAAESAAAVDLEPEKEADPLHLAVERLDALGTVLAETAGKVKDAFDEGIKGVELKLSLLGQLNFAAAEECEKVAEGPGSELAAVGADVADMQASVRDNLVALEEAESALDALHALADSLDLQTRAMEREVVG